MYYNTLFVILAVLISVEEFLNFGFVFYCKWHTFWNQRLVFFNVTITDLRSRGSRLPSLTSSRRPCLPSLTLSQIAKQVNGNAPSHPHLSWYQSIIKLNKTKFLKSRKLPFIMYIYHVPSTVLLSTWIISFNKTIVQLIVLSFHLIDKEMDW